MKKRGIIIAVTILALLVVFFFYNRSRQQQLAKASAKYETVAVQRGQLTATIGGTGSVHANQTVVLTWQTSGTVEKVNVKVGDQVSAGMELANLRRDSLPQNIIMAQADLTQAKQALEDLYTNAETQKNNAMQAITKYANAVRDAQYQLDNFTVPTSQIGLDPIEALDKMKQKLDQARAAFEPYKYKSVDDPTRKDLKEALDNAQSDYDAAVKRLQYVYNLDVATSNLNKARQDYEKWKNGPAPEDVAAAEARIAAAEATVNLAKLTAPFSGTVTQVEIKPGDQVTPGKIAFRIDDLSSLQVDVEISEVDINRVQIGQDAILNFDAILGKDYHGKVKEVAPVGTINQGVVDFIVTIELNDADAQVKPGMTAAANIIVEQLNDVLMVPNRAVRLVEGKRVVYILRNGTPQPVPVTLGASSDVNSQVLEGEIKVGDLVVLNPPVTFQRNGQPPFANGGN